MSKLFIGRPCFVMLKKWNPEMRERINDFVPATFIRFGEAVDYPDGRNFAVVTKAILELDDGTVFIAAPESVVFTDKEEKKMPGPLADEPGDPATTNKKEGLCPLS